MKKGRDESQEESRERGRGADHYKGKEKSKWKSGATKECSSLPLDESESQAKS